MWPFLVLVVAAWTGVLRYALLLASVHRLSSTPQTRKMRCALAQVPSPLAPRCPALSRPVLASQPGSPSAAAAAMAAAPPARGCEASASVEQAADECCSAQSEDNARRLRVRVCNATSCASLVLDEEETVRSMLLRGGVPCAEAGQVGAFVNGTWRVLPAASTLAGEHRRGQLCRLSRSREPVECIISASSPALEQTRWGACPGSLRSRTCSCRWLHRAVPAAVAAPTERGRRRLPGLALSL
jgi:hypothetical protein